MSTWSRFGLPVIPWSDHRSRPTEPWPKSFLRIGHAGAGAYAPPNTLKSLALALDLGVDTVEFDVRPCRDALVLLHDDDLSHFDGARGLASQRSYADLRCPGRCHNAVPPGYLASGIGPASSDRGTGHCLDGG